MPFQIIYHPLAEKEYLESIVWYEENLPGLGRDFMIEVEKVLNQIELNPFLFPLKKLQFREAIINSFPYIIVYKIIPHKQQILIVAIFHTSRNPFEKYRG